MFSLASLGTCPNDPRSSVSGSGPLLSLASAHLVRLNMRVPFHRWGVYYLIDSILPYCTSYNSGTNLVPLFSICPAGTRMYSSWALHTRAFPLLH